MIIKKILECRQNNKQILTSTLLFIYTSIRTMLATLLTIFVYRVCPHLNNTYKDCSIGDNFMNLTKMNLIALIFNFVALMTFICFYGLEYYRECKYIKYLDVDTNLPTTNLKNEIVCYPKIENKLNKLNVHYRNFSIILFLINITNIILSAIIVYNYYGGYKSIVGFISESFLVVDKLYNSIVIAYKSVNEILPYSAYLKEYMVFNTIDPKYKLKKQIKLEKLYDNEMYNIKKFRESKM